MWDEYSYPVLNCEPSHLSGGAWKSYKTNRGVRNWDMNRVAFEHEPVTDTVTVVRGNVVNEKMQESECEARVTSRTKKKKTHRQRE
jgi:hypothetical protein